MTAYSTVILSPFVNINFQSPHFQHFSDQ